MKNLNCLVISNSIHSNSYQYLEYNFYNIQYAEGSEIITKVSFSIKFVELIFSRFNWHINTYIGYFKKIKIYIEYWHIFFEV